MSDVLDYALNTSVVNNSNDFAETKLTMTERCSMACSEVLTTNSLHESVSDAVKESCMGVTQLSYVEPNHGMPDSSLYHLKWFPWNGQLTPIVMQNQNGPCPLLSIANVLMLTRKIIIPRMQEIISGTQLVEYIGDCILAGAPKPEGCEEIVLNYQQNMHDAICIMGKLQTGMDVNVKFSGCSSFEYTKECIVFDLLQIALYHGWLVDPQDEKLVKAVDRLSYNQLVENIISSKQGGDATLEHNGLIAEEFLHSTASQLTCHGLCELNTSVQENELCVFFRNNHFSTLYKRGGGLFLLVTDQGFLTEPNVIWEALVNIEGDGYFADAEFKRVTLPHVSASSKLYARSLSNVHLESYGAVGRGGKNLSTENGESRPDVSMTSSSVMSQEDRDYLIALHLQQDLHQLHSDDDVPSESVNLPGVIDDHMLALRLQREEEERVDLVQALPNHGGEVASPGARQTTEGEFKRVTLPHVSASSELYARGLSNVHRESYGAVGRGEKNLSTGNGESRSDVSMTSSSVMSQEDRDYLIALHLQQDLHQLHSDDDGSSESVNLSPGVIDDHMLALRLQREKEERVDLVQALPNHDGEVASPGARQTTEVPSLPNRQAGPGEGIAVQQAHPRRREPEKGFCCLL